MSPTREVVEDGIVFKSSIVNTLVKKLFRISALSFGVIALEPSALVRDGIDCFGFQSGLSVLPEQFGFLFTLNAKFNDFVLVLKSN